MVIFYCRECGKQNEPGLGVSIVANRDAVIKNMKITFNIECPHCHQVAKMTIKDMGRFS